jgi:hypothetical protein
MAELRRRFGPVLGIAGAAALAWFTARGFAGSGQALPAHLGLGGLALVALTLGLARPGLRGTLMPAALVLAAVTGASALLPGLIQARALAVAEGRPFCLLPPERATDPDARRDRVYRVAPALQARDLTLLTLPRPLTLALWVTAPDPDIPLGDKPDGVFETWTFRLADRRFVRTETFHLQSLRLSILADCLPKAQPFAPDPQATALVVYRPALTGADGRPGWGPRAADLYRFPPDSQPFHAGRFIRATLGFSAPVLPDGGPLQLTIRFLDAPADWLSHSMAMRVRDDDAPLDFATLPVNALGLHALEYASTYAAGQIDGTYAAFAPDGQARTVIACGSRSCDHAFLPDLPFGPARLMVTVSYPPARLPDWQAVEANATRALAEALATP